MNGYMKKALLYGFVANLLLVWGAACATQYMAHQLGFSDVLGSPLVSWTSRTWVSTALTHGAAALGGAGVAWLPRTKLTGVSLLGGASLLLFLAAGPIYSPHLVLTWGELMWADETLFGVLQRAAMCGVCSVGWAAGLGYTAIRETQHAKKRWREAPASLPQPESPAGTTPVDNTAATEKHQGSSRRKRVFTLSAESAETSSASEKSRQSGGGRQTKSARTARTEPGQLPSAPAGDEHPLESPPLENGKTIATPADDSRTAFGTRLGPVGHGIDTVEPRRDL